MCMYSCVCVYVCILVYVYVYVFVCVCACVYEHVLMCMCVSVCTGLNGSTPLLVDAVGSSSVRRLHIGGNFGKSK